MICSVRGGEDHRDSLEGKKKTMGTPKKMLDGGREEKSFPSEKREKILLFWSSGIQTQSKIEKEGSPARRGKRPFSFERESFKSD